MYALCFNFQVSNNEAEYEALLSVLRLAREVGAKHFAALSDSLLITNQINGTYEAKDQRIQRYINTVRELAQSFKSFSIKQIPRGENTRADALSKLSSTSFDHLTNKFVVEIIPGRSIDNKQVGIITTTPYWTIPFTYYLLHGILLDDPTEARRIKMKAPYFIVRDT